MARLAKCSFVRQCHGHELICARKKSPSVNENNTAVTRTLNKTSRTDERLAGHSMTRIVNWRQRSFIVRFIEYLFYVPELITIPNEFSFN